MSSKISRVLLVILDVGIAMIAFLLNHEASLFKRIHQLYTVAVSS